MKRILIAILAVLLLALPAFALSPVYTLLNAVTSAGAGTAQTLYKPMHMFNCNLAVGGTAPTDWSITLEGSIDGTTYGTLTTDASPNYTFRAVDYPVNYIRGNYVSKTDGDATTSFTLKCIGIGF